MTYPPVSAAKSNVYQINDYRRKSPLKHRKEGFNGLTRILSRSGLLNFPQRIVLGIIFSACAYGFVKRSKAWLCQETGRAYSTICRIVNQLEKMGFIETVGRGAAFEIHLTDICYLDDIDEIKRRLEQIKTDRQVLTCEKKPLTSEKFTLMYNKKTEKKDTEPPPDKPPEPPPGPPENNQAAPGLFSKDQIEKMGDYSQQIIDLCKRILILPAKNGTTFNPMQAIGKSLKNGKQPGAIAETINGMAKYWDTVENPWKVYENQLKIKNQNFNARNAENESKMHKNSLNTLKFELFNIL